MTDLLTRLRTEADLCRNEGAEDVAALLDEAAVQLAEAQRDAGRYRWLRCAIGDDYFAVCEPDGECGDVLKHEDELDAAIDAALAAEGDT